LQVVAQFHRLWLSFAGMSHLLANSTGWVFAPALQTLIDCIGIVIEKILLN